MDSEDSTCATNADDASRVIQAMRDQETKNDDARGLEEMNAVLCYTKERPENRRGSPKEKKKMTCKVQ